ncbi:MAG: tRNA glutamyl-Q(34) synthetase GluQRS [Pseudomonadota bacterium]
MPINPVTRFAPSPTGYLHRGHAYSALLNAALADARGGSMILRIENADQGRCRPAFETALFDDLAWLGITWDEPALYQAERFDLYREAIDRLQTDGLLYRCFKTRAELVSLAAAPHGPGPKPPLTARLPEREERRLLDDGKPFAWRLDAAAARAAIGKDELTWTEEHPAAEAKESLDRSLLAHAPFTVHRFSLTDIGDDVLARKDFPMSYHLASTIDDNAQGVKLICRGEDLRSAIPIQRTIQELLGLTPPVYRHHHLITDDRGRRLAKRDRAATLQAAREKGITADEIKRQLFPNSSRA